MKKKDPAAELAAAHRRIAVLEVAAEMRARGVPASRAESFAQASLADAEISGEGDEVMFSATSPKGDALFSAASVAEEWLSDFPVDRIGVADGFANVASSQDAAPPGAGLIPGDRSSAGLIAKALDRMVRKQARAEQKARPFESDVAPDHKDQSARDLIAQGLSL